MRHFILNTSRILVPVLVLAISSMAAAQLRTNTTTQTISNEPVVNESLQNDLAIAIASAQTGWYHPKSFDPQPKVVEKPAGKRKKYYLTLSSDTHFHGGVLNNVNMNGAGEMLLLRVGSTVGTSIGLLAGGPHFVWTFDVLRNAGKQVKDFGGMGLWILFPTVSAELTLVDGLDEFSFGLGGALTGLRFTTCKPFGMMVDFRALTWHLYNSLGSNGVSGQFAVGLGFSFDAGIMF